MLTRIEGLIGKSITSFSKFQIFDAVWLNAKIWFVLPETPGAWQNKSAVAGLDYNDVDLLLIRLSG